MRAERRQHEPLAQHIDGRLVTEGQSRRAERLQRLADQRAVPHLAQVAPGGHRSPADIAVAPALDRGQVDELDAGSEPPREPARGQPDCGERGPRASGANRR